MVGMELFGASKSIFKGRFVGVDAASGTAFPDLEKYLKHMIFLIMQQVIWRN